MEETKTKMEVKSSVEINNSPERKLQPLTAVTKTTPVSQRRHDNDSYWDSFPAGYRFCPFDSELIVYYLKKKIMNERLPPNRINDVNLYQFNPHDLAGMRIERTLSYSFQIFNVIFHYHNFLFSWRCS